VGVIAWIVFLVFALPIIGFLVWVLLEKSFVRIPMGKLGLIVVRGKATDKVLLPGNHFVPSFRRMMVEEYPSLELSYLAGEDATLTEDEASLQHVDPPLRATLGDRADVTVRYTVRFRLMPDHLKSIHERFGHNGLWAIVRDQSRASVIEVLSRPEFGTEDAFGPARGSLEDALGTAAREVMADEGFVMTMFSLRAVDLGRTGEVIQATVRARAELEREGAAAATRLARARNDAELYVQLGATLTDEVLRHQQIDVWRELVERWDTHGVASLDRGITPTAAGVTPPPPAPARERLIERPVRREDAAAEDTTP
jgi:regulator of protease activity HflC (stomatin/prohibitin superfamily)